MRRKGDIDKLGDHKLSKLVLNCIEDHSDKRPNAVEVVNCLQRELSKLQKKEQIFRRPKPCLCPRLRVVALGASGTGKTCIINRFVHGSYPLEVFLTLGEDFYYKNISLGDKDYRLQIIDIAGLEKFYSTAHMLVRNVDGILLVFDIQRRDSLLEGIPKMLKLLDAAKADATGIILVGNKVDLKSREVTSSEAEQYARELGVQYIETSAKTGENVQKLFEEMTREIYETLDLSDMDVFVPSAGDIRIHLEDDAPRNQNICEKMRNWMCG